MWRLILVAASIAVTCYGGEELTIFSWNMQWFPSGERLRADPEIERDRIQKAADVMRAAAPDVLVLQEIRDEATASELVRAIGLNYELVVCSNFRDRVGGAPTWQQLALFARLRAKSAWAEDWDTSGPVDPPRGFVFAHFSIGDSDVGIYGVHLKSNLRSEDPRQNQLNLLKRELALDQLLAHRKSVESKIHLPLDVVIIAGDFNTNYDDPRFVSESTLRMLELNGYTTAFLTVDPSARITVPASGRYAAATFDFIYQSGGTWTVPVTVIGSDLSDHRPIVGTISVSAGLTSAALLE